MYIHITMLFSIYFTNDKIFITQKPAVKTTVGLLECPLGNTRLHVAKLLSALLATENLKIHESLETLGTFQTLLVRSYYMSMRISLRVFIILSTFVYLFLTQTCIIGSVFQIYLE